MDKIPGSPFQSTPANTPQLNPTHQNVPTPSDVEMTQASISGIKRKVREISHDRTI